MNEREKKFINLAEKRMNKLIKQIRLVGNLSNKRNYQYSDVQANKIIRRLNMEFSNLKQRFRNGDQSSSDKFTF